MSADAKGYPDELMASYAASGFTAGAGEKKGGYPFGDHPALLVIDVCNAYLTEGSPLYGKDRFQTALDSCEKTITLCRENGIPVIFSRVVYHDRGADGGNWYKFKLPKALCAFDKGNVLGDYPTNSKICRPFAGETVIEKQYSSCFFGTSLASTLIRLKTDTLLVCGYSTSGCYGFNPYVIADACGDRDEYPHKANLFDMKAKFAEVVTSDELAMLIKDV
ncbi:Isochorismatase hydrolase [Lophium mytilinum]|uniref:Isochorismatase hydrolase n=1 Tax=Lophium mytilinum TaxID=390894 RepID=A0A6A6RI65_9PEZI|nr:Isochorismatase hydrolase [Lophium mytilinum]